MPQCQGHHNKVVAHGHVNGFVVVCEYGGRTGLIFYVKSLQSPDQTPLERSFSNTGPHRAGLFRSALTHGLTYYHPALGPCSPVAETNVAQEEMQTPGYCIRPTLMGLMALEPCGRQQRLFTGSGSWWKLEGDGY